MSAESLSRPCESAALSPSSEREGFTQVEVDKIGFIAIADDSLLEAWEFSDLDGAPFATHQIDEVSLERVAQMVCYRRSGKPQEVPRPDFDLGSVYLGNPAPRQNIHELLLMMVEMVRE